MKLSVWKIGAPKKLPKMSKMSTSNKKIKPIARTRTRRLLLQALYQWQMSDDLPEKISEQYMHDKKMAKADSDYFFELWNEIISGHENLDKHVEFFMDRPIKELDAIELAILRIGAYELEKRMDIPYRVVINESLELAKSFGGTDSFKYINGILDKLAKQLRADEFNS